MFIQHSFHFLDGENVHNYFKDVRKNGYENVHLYIWKEVFNSDIPTGKTIQ